MKVPEHPRIYWTESAHCLLHILFSLLSCLFVLSRALRRNCARISCANVLIRKQSENKHQLGVLRNNLSLCRELYYKASLLFVMQRGALEREWMRCVREQVPAELRQEGKWRYGFISTCIPEEDTRLLPSLLLTLSLLFFFLWHFGTPSLPVFLPNFSSPEFSSREDTASVLSLFLSLFLFLSVYEPCGVRCWHIKRTVIWRH